MQYYLAIKRNELLGHEKTGTDSINNNNNNKSPWRLKLQWAVTMPLHPSLGEQSKTLPIKKKKSLNCTSNKMNYRCDEYYKYSGEYKKARENIHHDEILLYCLKNIVWIRIYCLFDKTRKAKKWLLEGQFLSLEGSIKKEHLRDFWGW